MAYGLSNGHVTFDATWPWKVKLVTPIRLERNIWKTAGFRDSVPKDHHWEMAYGLSNSCVTDDFTWSPKVLWGSKVGYPSDSLASCFICCRLSFYICDWQWLVQWTAYYSDFFSYCPFQQESHAVAGKPRDAAVNSDRYQQTVGQKQMRKWKYHLTFSGTGTAHNLYCYV